MAFYDLDGKTKRAVAIDELVMAVSVGTLEHEEDCRCGLCTALEGSVDEGDRLPGPLGRAGCKAAATGPKSSFNQLVALAIIDETNSLDMFGVPIPHFLVSPGPLEGMGVTAVVLRPRGVDMIDVFSTVLEGTPLEIMIAERLVEKFRLVKPGGMHGRESGSPPTGAGGEIIGRPLCDVRRIVVLDQVNAIQPTMPLSEALQQPGIIEGAFVVQTKSIHLSGMDREQDHQIDGSVPRIFELLSLDLSRLGSADRVALQDLEIGHFISAHHPNALRYQTLSIRVAPKSFLGAVLELGIQMRSLPVSCAVRSEGHAIEDSSDGPGTDARNNPFSHRLTRHVLARPMSDMQASGDGLQACEFNDSRLLEGGNPGWMPGAGLHGQQSLQPMFLVATADPPNRCPSILFPTNHFPDAVARRNCQDNSRSLHLEPGQRLAAGDPFQTGPISGINGKLKRFSTTHTFASNATGRFPA